MSEPKITDLVPLPEGGALVELDPLVNDPNIDSDDIVVPSLSLLQGQSPEVLAGNGRPGQFFDSQQGIALVPPLKAIVAWHGKTRFKGRGKPQGTEMCRSSDMVHGSVYGLCETCQYKEWQELDNGRRKAPSCAQNQVFVLHTTSGPLMLRMKNKAEKYARMFLTQKAALQRNFWQHPVVLRVKSEAGKDEGGNPTTYFAATISWLLEEVVPEATRVAAKRLHEALQDAAEVGRLQTTEESD